MKSEKQDNNNTPMTPIPGSCLCGRVQFEIIGPFMGFRYCHCERCRKTTGSSYATNIYFPKDQLKWLAGQEDIIIFIHKEADNYPRGFCRQCGGPVPRLARDGVRMVVPAGTLDADPGLTPQENIFWKLRAPWLIPFEDLPKHEEYPPTK